MLSCMREPRPDDAYDTRAHPRAARPVTLRGGSPAVPAEIAPTGARGAEQRWTRRSSGGSRNAPEAGGVSRSGDAVFEGVYDVLGRWGAHGVEARSPAAPRVVGAGRRAASRRAAGSWSESPRAPPPRPVVLGALGCSRHSRKGSRTAGPSPAPSRAGRSRNRGSVDKRSPAHTHGTDRYSRAYRSQHPSSSRK